ncbi:MAG: hypothetical protein HOY78_23605 [Saccharothrix sp.]|nr:hypothetical protein [Saccharothrix sp.]
MEICTASGLGGALLASLGDAYARLEDDPRARAGVLHANGKHFTGGLDLAQVADRIAEGTARNRVQP